MFLSHAFYFFVAYLNIGNVVNSNGNVNYTALDAIIKIIPLIIGIILSFVSYFIYFKKLTIKNSKLFLIPKIINIGIIIFGMYYSFELWKVRPKFLVSITVFIVYCLLLIIGLFSIALHLKKNKKF